MVRLSKVTLDAVSNPHFGRLSDKREIRRVVECSLIFTVGRLNFYSNKTLYRKSLFHKSISNTVHIVCLNGSLNHNRKKQSLNFPILIRRA